MGRNVGFERPVPISFTTDLLSSMAGADPVAIHLRAVFWFLMKEPQTLEKLVKEINDADKAGKLSKRIQYSEVVHLPYLSACIKEAARIFPAWAIHQPRVAPANGVQLSGYYIPKGYRVGVNPAAVQRDRGVFGEDADVFRPERWLESQERNFAMEKAMMNFGAGTRTCSGKNVGVNMFDLNSSKD